MITTINKDILTVDKGVIVHFCNCLGAMGGLAGAIARKWPIVKESYLKSLEDREQQVGHKVFALGGIDIIRVEKPLWVINAFTQYNFGSGRHTEYAAVLSCLRSVERTAQGLDIYLPYMVGCGLGGGDWSIVQKIIEKTFENYGGNVYICKHE